MPDVDEERWATVEEICRANMKDLILQDPPKRSHPAKYSTEVLVELDHVVSAEADRLGRRLRIIDPFAGVGRIHRFDEAAHRVVGVDLEPEWAIQGLPGLTWCGDSTATPFPSSSFDVWCTSPVFSNRMSDHHEAKDTCKRCGGTGADPEGERKCTACGGRGLSRRHTYRHYLERPLTRGSASTLGWGAPYRRLHSTAIQEGLRLLMSGGLMVVNIANHLRTVGPEGNRRQEEQRVTEWWVNEMMAVGCNVVEVRGVATRKQRQGQNYEARTDGEKILVMRAPAKRERTLLDEGRPFRPTEVVATNGRL